MDQHMTYDKEKMLKEGYEQTPDQEGKEKKPPKYIWSYIIKPVRKDYSDDKWLINHFKEKFSIRSLSSADYYY